MLTCGQTLKDGASSHSATGNTQFLWYTGHWSKTNKNQFIVDKNSGVGSGVGGAAGSSGGSGGGGTITIGSDGSVQMSGATVDAWNKKMDEAEQSADQYLQLLNNPGDNLEPSTHRFYELLRPDAEAQKQQVAALKIDPKQDILTPGQAGKPASNFDAAAAYCKSVRSDYDQVMAFYKDHVKDHDADLNVPLPPGFEYECATCDSNIRNVYASTINNYIRDFMHPEDSIIRKGAEILHQVALGQSHLQVAMSADDYSALFNPNTKDPSKSGPCSYIDMTELSNAVNQTIRHLYLRAKKLVTDNQKNFRAAEAVSRTFMIIARQWELSSGGHSGYEEMYPVIQETVGKAIDFYVQKLKNNDWREIGNLTYILSLFRQQALFGGANNDKATDEFLADLQKVINGFELSVEMEIKVGNGPSYEYAHVKGKCHIIPEFSRDTDQCYKWVVADDNGPTESLGFYKKKNLQSIDFDVITNERVSPPQIPKMTYTGTKYYTALLRNLSMDFCNPGHDTIMLSGFVPNPPSKGTWVIPNVGKQNMGLNNMEQFFESMEEKKKLEESGEAQKQSDEMQQKAEQLRAKMEALQKDASLQNSGQGGNPNNMEKIQELREQMEALSTNSALGMMLYIDFLLPVQNNDMTLVKHVYDAKEINPEEAPAIMIGNYSIQIQNKQNGPTKKLQAPVHVDNTIPKK
jgi:hypothetical protein